MRHHIRAAVLLATLAGGSTTIASAQTMPGGLFGGSRSDTGDGNTFNVTFTLAESYDTEVPAEFRSRLPQTGPQSGGLSTMLTTSAVYMNAGRRGRIAGSGQSAFRYYQQLSDVAPVSHSAAIGGRLNLSRTAGIELNQTAAYSPLYMFQLFPGTAPVGLGETAAAAPDFRVDRTESYSYGTTVSFSVGQAQGNQLSMSADRHQTDHQSPSVARPDMITYSGRAGYRRGIGRRGGLSLEYEYRTGEFQVGAADEHRVNVGAEYTRVLSASRQARFRIEVSPSLIDISKATQAVPAGQVQRLEAAASLDYQFHRAWRAGASYRRATDYVPSFVEPVFADSASVQLNGLISRRFNVGAAASYAKGGSVLTGSQNQFDTYTGTARLQFALTRTLAVYTEYLYYFYDLRGQAGLAPGLPPTFEQSGARVGLTLWVPVF